MVLRDSQSALKRLRNDVGSGAGKMANSCKKANFPMCFFDIFGGMDLDPQGGPRASFKQSFKQLEMNKKRSVKSYLWRLFKRFLKSMLIVVLVVVLVKVLVIF